MQLIAGLKNQILLKVNELSMKEEHMERKHR